MKMMFHVLFLCFIFLLRMRVYISSAAARNKCPVSDILTDIDNHHLYRYPNIFFNFTGAPSFDEETAYNCTVGTQYPYFTNPTISCPREDLCPLHSTNVAIAMEKMKNWSPSNVAFTRFEERMKLIAAKNATGTLQELASDPIEVKLFVFGGNDLCDITT